MQPKKGLISYMDDEDDEGMDTSTKYAPVSKEKRQIGNALGLDDMLFGGGMKRTPPPAKPAPAPAKPAPTTVPTPPPAVVIPKNPPTSNVSQPSPVQPPKTPTIEKPVVSPPAKKPEPKPEPPKPEPKVDVVYKPPTGISTYQNLLNVKPGSFNRPAYIRKFKKLADNYGYRERNERFNQVDNVLKLGQCYYSEVKKLSRSGFVDLEFPPNYTAFTDNVKERKIGFFNDWNNWSAPKDVFRAPVLGKYIDPNDIERGMFSSDFLVSCLASLAEKENNIKRLIEEQALTETGFYYVRINVNGVWRYIAVDHSIPVHKDGRVVASHSYADEETELWPTLIEKAYTKVYGTYEQYSRSQSREAYLRDLTGAPVRIYSPSDANVLKVIESALEKGYVVQAAPTERLLTYGLNPNLTLTVLRVDSNRRTIQFRTSFGTIDEKPRFNLSKEGTFEVSADEARSFTNYFLVGEVHDDYYTSTIQARHRPGFFSTYSFRVRSEMFEGYLMASQFDRRQFNQPTNLYAQEAKVEVTNPNHYENSPLGLFIYRKDDDDVAREVVSASIRAKNLDVPVRLTTGEYIVFLTMNWVDRDYDFNISAYGSELITFKRIHNKNNPSLVASGINVQAIRDGPQVR